MSRHFFVINIVLAIVDTIVCGIVVAGFCIGAIYFEKWWMLLFSFIPLGLYSNHGVICDSDIQRSQIDALKPQEKEHD